MPLKNVRYCLSLGLLGVIAYYMVTRIPRGWRHVLFEWPVFTHAHELKPDWPLRLLSMVLLLVFWGGVFLLTKKTLIRAHASPGSAIEYIFAHLGLGALLSLGLALVAPVLHGPFATLFLLWAPWLVSTSILLLRAPAPQASSQNTSSPSKLLRWTFYVLVGFLFIRVGSQFWYSVFLKPTAVWDEVFMWYPSVEFLTGNGLAEYLKGFAVRRYDPGYPLLASAALLPVSGKSWIAASSNFAGLFFGLCTLTLLLERVWSGRRRMEYFVLAVLFYYTVVLTQGGWLAVLQWRPGNGDGIAALMCTILFLQLGTVEARIPGAMKLLCAFGIGFLAQIIKPPLTPLLIPSLVLLLPMVLLLIARHRRKSFLFVWGAIFSGAVAGKLIWALIRQEYGFRSEYNITLSQLLAYQFSEQSRLVIELIYTTYKVQFVIFFALAALALARKGQKIIFPFFLMAAGFIGAVIWLYMTMWNHVEHESGGRYFSHTLLAWIWLYLVKEKRFLLAGFKELGRQFYRAYLWTKSGRFFPETDSKDASS